MTFLAIDIGNTRLKWAMYSRTGNNQSPLAQGAVFLERIEDLAQKDWCNLPEPAHILGSCVAADAAKISVNEQLEIWNTTPVWVQARSKQCGVTNWYDHPYRLGVDRWLALIGTYQKMLAQPLEQPAIVVMVGTAVTIDTLDTQGNFLGGMIMPGYGIMLNALQTGTAGLHVPTGQVQNFPTNTSDALITGGTFAITGAIERMAHNLQERTQQEPKIFLAGGGAWKVAPSFTKPYTLVESLIFDGLLAVAGEIWPEEHK